MDNFIGVYENVLSQELCDKFISFTDKYNDIGFGISRPANRQSKSIADDTALFLGHMILSQELKSCGELYDAFIKELWGVYDRYKDTYAVALDNVVTGPLHVFETKIQKTSPGQGYHSWHYESASRDVADRLLVYTAYLNDVEEGGETEFLYQHTRVKPKRGTITIFPGSFTHTHRGNPPLSGDKYIITGWFQL